MKLLALLLLSGCVVFSVVPLASAGPSTWVNGEPTWLYVSDFQCSVFDPNLPNYDPKDPKQVLNAGGQAGFAYGYAVAAMTFFTPGFLSSSNPSMTVARFTQAMIAKCRENPNLRLVDVARWIMTGTPIPGGR